MVAVTDFLQFDGGQMLCDTHKRRKGRPLCLYN
jgi:hypothetical protein